MSAATLFEAPALEALDVPPDVRARALKREAIDPIGSKSDLLAILPVALVAWGYEETPRALFDALPIDAAELDLTDLRNALGRLGFPVHERPFDPNRLRRNGDLPALVVPDASPAFVLLARKGSNWIIARDCKGNVEEISDARLGQASGRVIIRIEYPTETNRKAKGGWFAQELRTYRPLLLKLFGLSALSNALMLGVPLFVMAVYDKVISAHSPRTLFYLATGVVLALGLDLWIKKIRSSSLAFSGARLSYQVGNQIFERLLDLPLSMTERASVAAQVARVRDIERVRDLLTGPLAIACMDLPFSLLFVGVLFAFAGWIAVIPLIGLAVYALLGFALMRHLNRRIALSARAGLDRQEIIQEVLEHLPIIRDSGTEPQWRERFRAANVDNARKGFVTSFETSTIATLSQTVAATAGLAMLGLGVGGVLEGTLTTGALITAMILLWRILAPMQGVFVAVSRIHQLRSSVRQIDRLMELPVESRPDRDWLARERPSGDIVFDRVTFRYGRGDPELMGIGFRVEPGEIMTIVGGNGGGKSTILKLIAGLVESQSGSIRLGGRDIRQYDPESLRQHVGLVTQTPAIFPATVAENLRLAAPLATDEALLEALETASAREMVEDLPGGLEAQIDARIPTGLATRLNLARVLLGKPSIVLMDEPVIGLDYMGDFAFVESMVALRERGVTVAVVTHRPGHVRVADKVLVLDRGNVRYFGPVEPVLDKLSERLM